MGDPDQNIVLLRTILENLDHPENLDDHPWSTSFLVKDTVNQTPGLMNLSPGFQLVETVSRIFHLMMPNSSPRRGLRLDTHWGEFGILASQYFAPREFNFPYPGSLREAWQNIDKAILHYVFGNNNNISQEDRLRFQLIGNEPEVAPNSTISDWHRKGIERFSIFLDQYMKQSEIKSKIGESSTHHEESKNKNLKKSLRLLKVSAAWFAGIIFLLMFCILAVGLFKGWGLYQKANSLKQQAEEILAFYQSNPEPEKIPEISQNVTTLRTDLESLQKDSSLLISLSRYLGWIPVYGGDISQTPELVELAVQLSITGDEVLKAVSPLLNTEANEKPSSNLIDLISQLKNADSELLAAQVSFANALALRQRIITENLSPVVRKLLIEKIDPLLFSMNAAFPVTDLLQIARLAPRLLGAVDNGQQTYLILIQNEDELRPTGGYLTAAGLLKVENGEILELSFDSSEMVDDFNKPYPKPPWQLDEYMMAEILLFRDSNWFTNFPTTVEWAKFLYAYTRSKNVDGVITVNQRVIQELLRIVGPIDVVGIEVPISSENVLSYMRSAKENTPPPGVSVKEWDRKQFISWLADPLINKLLTIESEKWKDISQVLIQLLDEKHILLQFDDPEMSSMIAKRGWTGAVIPEPASDFLMVVDSNIGFNKTNALMQTGIDYAVNLEDLNRPTGNLKVKFTNNSKLSQEANSECIQAGGDIRDIPLDQRDYLMNDCYWTYLRIYIPSNTNLISSSKHEIPQKWPLREKAIHARTDFLDENIAGTQTFGKLLVVPIGQSLMTDYAYQMPASVITSENDNKSFTYKLKIQKQPGTQAIPLTFHLILPPGMTIIKSSPELVQVQQNLNQWKFETKLDVDTTIEVTFQ